MIAQAILKNRKLTPAQLRVQGAKDALKLLNTEKLVPTPMCYLDTNHLSILGWYSIAAVDLQVKSFTRKLQCLCYWNTVCCYGQQAQRLNSKSFR